MANQYIATEPLEIGYVRAHNAGDPVPEENIEANGWGDKVAKVGTKAAEKAVAAHLEDVSEAPAPAPTK